MLFGVGLILGTARVPFRASLSMATRNPHNLPVKTCVVCNREFTWRKKWENCWDEVQTCSKRCNGERKKANRIAKGAAAAEGSPTSDSSSDDEAAVDDPKGKAARKASKKLQKAERRAKRTGDTSMGIFGRKACDLCDRSVDLLIRCQISKGNEWKMVCGKCWKTPAVAGGVVDGTSANPHYQYGGLWKNHHRP